MKIPQVVMTHPFEMAIAAGMLLVGGQSLLTSDPMNALAERDLGSVMSVLWQVGVILGGLSVLVSLIAKPALTRQGQGLASWGRTVERVGLILISTSCMVWASVLLFGNDGDNYFSIVMVLSVGVGSALRSLAIRQADMQVLESLKVINEVARNIEAE